MGKRHGNTDADIIRRDQHIALRIIKRFARGNVRMQHAAMLSRKLLDEQAKARAVQIARLRKIYAV